MKHYLQWILTFIFFNAFQNPPQVLKCFDSPWTLVHILWYMPVMPHMFIRAQLPHLCASLQPQQTQEFFLCLILVAVKKFFPNSIISWSEVATVPTGSLFVLIWLRTSLSNCWFVCLCHFYLVSIFHFLVSYQSGFLLDTFLCLNADVDRRNLLPPLHQTKC